MRTQASSPRHTSAPRSAGLPDPWRARSVPVAAPASPAREGGPPGHDFGRLAVPSAPVIQRYWYRGANGVEWRDGEPGSDLEDTGERHNTNVHGEGAVYEDRRASRPKRGLEGFPGPSGEIKRKRQPDVDDDDAAPRGEASAYDPHEEYGHENGAPRSDPPVQHDARVGPPSPAESFMSSYPAVAAEVFKRLPYSDLGTMMQVSRQARGVAADLAASRTVKGLPVGMYYGMAKAVGKTAPDATVASHDAPTAHQVGTPDWPADPETTRDVVRALGWREHVSPLGRAEGRGSGTLNDFAERTREHAEVTAKLRSGRVDEMYPKQANWGNHADTKRRLAQVGAHWVRTLDTPFGAEKEPRPHDLEAIGLAKHHQHDHAAQNFSVATDQVPGQPHAKRVYTNLPLAQPDVRQITASGFQPAEQDRSTWSLKEGYGRTDHGSGADTPANRSIPFHSEAQRLRTLEPYQLGYSGNNYLACPQCAMAYHAIGQTGFRGTHGNKARSIIPQPIRENSVYLSRYIGSEAFGELKDKPASEMGRFLDLVEREEKGFPGRHGVTPPKGYEKPTSGRLTRRWK